TWATHDTVGDGVHHHLAAVDVVGQLDPEEEAAVGLAEGDIGRAVRLKRVHGDVALRAVQRVDLGQVGIVETLPEELGHDAACPLADAEVALNGREPGND